MTNQFAETITYVQEVAGFDSVAQAMQFAKTPSFIEVGTMQWDIWHAEKKQFFKTLFKNNPLAACLCYALAQSMMEAIDTNDFSEVYENNKDERFARWFEIFLDDFSMISTCGYFGTDADVDHDQLFNLIGKDIRDFQRGKINARPLSEYIDILEAEKIDSLRMDAKYFAELSMQENHTFYSANTIATSLGIDDSTSYEYRHIKDVVWNVYRKYRFEIVDGLTTNLESV